MPTLCSEVEIEVWQEDQIRSEEGEVSCLSDFVQEKEEIRSEEKIWELIGYEGDKEVGKILSGSYVEILPIIHLRSAEVHGQADGGVVVGE